VYDIIGPLPSHEKKQRPVMPGVVVFKTLQPLEKHAPADAQQSNFRQNSGQLLDTTRRKLRPVTATEHMHKDARATHSFTTDYLQLLTGSGQLSAEDLHLLIAPLLA